MGDADPAIAALHNHAAAGPDRRRRRTFVSEHRQIVAALRDRDPKAARRAIHAHLAQAIDDLLALAEADALQQTRQKMAEERRNRARRTEI